MHEGEGQGGDEEPAGHDPAPAAADGGAAAVRCSTAGCPSRRRSSCPPEAAALLRADLAEARAAWIAEGQDAPQRAERAQDGFLAEVDAEGRRVDFHALRTTTGTMLALADVPRAVTQRIMGHASFSTTDRFYTRIGREAGRSAVELLPDLTPQVVLAPGTDGEAVPTVRPTVRNRGGSVMIHDDGGASGSVAGKIGGPPENPTNAGVSGAGEVKGRSGIRTHDCLRKRICNPSPWSTRACGRRGDMISLVAGRGKGGRWNRRLRRLGEGKACVVPRSRSRTREVERGSGCGGLVVFDSAAFRLRSTRTRTNRMGGGWTA